MEVPTSELEITKTEGASRQVEAAIAALMRGDFDIAVTLAGAAEGMLAREGVHLFPFLRDSSQVMDVPQKDWISVLNRERDWLKHSTRGETQTLTLSNFEAALMIARAASKLETWSPLMEDFKDWFIQALGADPQTGQAAAANE
jgi:hypothetical protein